jgi:hypothetical protein
MALKDVLGKEDYLWLIEFAEKNREKEIQHAMKSFEIERIDKLKAMSTESYLFRALSDPDFEKKLRQSGLAEHDAKRIGIIVAKLRFEKIWLDETRV